jgi:8-hydroxy-5-deazaflavin:NADPH oxidoreductase
VTSLGRDGGDASGSEVVLVAIPGDAIAEGLAKVTGLVGYISIDATNKFGERPSGFVSVAQQVRSLTRGPSA